MQILIDDEMKLFFRILFEYNLLQLSECRVADGTSKKPCQENGDCLYPGEKRCGKKQEIK